MAVPDVDDRVNAAITKFDNAASIAHDVANLPEFSYIPSESGPIPSVLEWLRVNTVALGGVPVLQSYVNALANPNDFTQGAAKIGYYGTDLATYLANGVGHTVTKASNIRNLKKGRNPWIQTGGRDQLGDGGAALYYEDTSGAPAVDDNLSCFVATDGGVYRLNHGGSINVKQAGAKGVSGVDDSVAFELCKTVCCKLSLEMVVPPVATEYTISVGMAIDQKIIIRGQVGGPINVYAGLPAGGSRIKYTGSGKLFYISTVQDPAKVGIEGTAIRDLILIGTAAATHGIQVGLPSDVGNALKVKSNIILDNCYIGDFKHGYGYQFNWCFSNTVTDVVVQNCGCAASLYYAHGTRIKGGNLEQSLVGLDNRISYGVVSDGVVLQGMDDTRQTTFGLAVPADFTVWSGWDGTGTTGASRTTPAGYAGTAVRNLGGILSIEGSTYWEYNNYCILTESDSDTSVDGGIVGLDSITKSFVQIGIGALRVDNVGFQGGSHAGLQGVFQTERNYAAPFYAGPGNVFPTTIPHAKVFTGPQSHVGTVNQWDPALFSMFRRDLGVFVNNGQALVPGSSGTVGNFNLAQYALSNKLRHILSGAGTTTITYVFTDAAVLRAVAGSSLSLHVIASGAATVTFSATNFRVPAAPFSLAANTQTIFRFEYSNGFWVIDGTPLNVPL